MSEPCMSKFMGMPIQVCFLIKSSCFLKIKFAFLNNFINFEMIILKCKISSVKICFYWTFRLNSVNEAKIVKVRDWKFLFLVTSDGAEHMLGVYAWAYARVLSMSKIGRIHVRNSINYEWNLLIWERVVEKLKSPSLQFQFV